MSSIQNSLMCIPRMQDNKLIVCERCGYEFDDITPEELIVIDNDLTRIYRNCFPAVEAHKQNVVEFVLENVTLAKDLPRPKPMPFPRKLANFVWSTVRHLAHGLPRANQETIATRLKICMSCPSNQWIPDSESSGQCAACGCCGGDENIFMNKLARADENCPHLHWHTIAR